MSGLSRDEATLAPPPLKWFEQHEGWLYFHLDCARRARTAIANADRGSSREASLRGRRDSALASARRHYDELVAAGWQPGHFIVSMIQAEGGLP